MTQANASSAQEAAVEHIVAWSSGDESCGEQLSVVGASRRGRVAVLRAAHRRVPGSLLVDAVGKTADALLHEVMDRVGVPPSRRDRPRWRAALKRRGKQRLVVVTGAQSAGLTRRSAQPGLVLDDLVPSLMLADLRVVTETEPHTGQKTAPGIYLAQASETNRLPCSDTDRRLLRALALSEPRRVPLPVWCRLVQGAGLGLPEEEELAALARRFPALLAVNGDGGDSPVMFFRDEDVSEDLRAEADPDLVRRVNAHVLGWLREQAPALRHREGWAASGPVGEYAATGLGMHAVQAGLFQELLADGEAVANIARAALLDAARCAHGERMPGGNLAADANYLAIYGVNPSTQPEWAAWLHIMATARGDVSLASDIAGPTGEAAGIRLPWKAKWARWRPPGGLHWTYLDPGAVDDLVEVRWEGRPAVVTLGGREGPVRVWDLDTGDLLAGPWTGQVIPEGPRAAITWADPVNQEQAGPTMLNELEAVSQWEDGPLWGWLPCMLRTEAAVVLAGPGGVLALEPVDGAKTFNGIEPFRPDLLGAPSAPGAVRPSTAPEPSPADLAALLGTHAVGRRVREEDLPAGLTDQASRRALADTGLPNLNRRRLRIQPRHESFLSEVTWPSYAPAPEATGPFFRLGEWMGGPVVLDGPGGRVLRVPSELDEPALEGSLVACGIEQFLTMAAQWLTGHRTRDIVGDGDEGHLLRQAVEGELRSIDPVGSRSGAWRHSLRDDVD